MLPSWPRHRYPVPPADLQLAFTKVDDAGPAGVSHRPSRSSVQRSVVHLPSVTRVQGGFDLSNFDFARASLPSVHADCVRAESYLSSDPAAACFYSRRAIEQLVRHVYDVAALTPPYRDDLAARISDPAFKAKVGNGIVQKLNLIRRVGNTAAPRGPADPAADRAAGAARAVPRRRLGGFHYSASPQAVPTDRPVRPGAGRPERAAVPRGPGQARGEVQGPGRGPRQGAGRARRPGRGQGRRDRGSARRRSPRRRRPTPRADDHDYSEAETRRLFIDVLLAEAGWPLDQEPRPGVPRQRACRTRTARASSTTCCGATTGCRWRSSRRSGRRRARRSASSRPSSTPTAWRPSSGGGRSIFCTNGYEHWLWDDAASAPRLPAAGGAGLLHPRRAGAA